MRTPALRLGALLVVFGWCLVIGALYESIYLVNRAWFHPSPGAHTFLLQLLHGPILHFGVGLGLWALARR